MVSKEELLEEFASKKERAENDDEFEWAGANVDENVLKRIAKWLSFLHVVDVDAGRDNTSTYRNRKSNIISWAGWCANNDVDFFAPEESDLWAHVDDIHGRLAGTSVSARTSTVCIHYLWASNRDHISENPFDGFALDDYELDIDANTPKQISVLISRGELKDENVIAIPPKAVKAIWQEADSLLVELGIRLLWETGLRAKELSTIEIGKTEYDDETTEQLRPNWSENKLGHLDRKERHINIKTAKTKPGDDNHWRDVWYSDQLDRLLHEYITGVRTESKYHEESPYLFVTSKKPQIRPSWISRKVKEAAYDAGLNEPLYTDAAGKDRHLITGHTLRHSFASYRANHSDMKLHILANTMGHRKLDTTRKYISKDSKAARHQNEDAHRKLRQEL
ncbi:integrase family protein (plasmid) [halophilic archaeon DL31]|jgi:integrase/recombinase XerD|nr:integrase family protein [halophilic archaeon DL31]